MGLGWLHVRALGRRPRISSLCAAQTHTPTAVASLRPTGAVTSDGEAVMGQTDAGRCPP